MSWEPITMPTLLLGAIAVAFGAWRLLEDLILDTFPVPCSPRFDQDPRGMPEDNGADRSLDGLHARISVHRNRPHGTLARCEQPSRWESRSLQLSC